MNELTKAVRDEVGQLSRDPFRDILTDYLECRPSRERIQELAEKDPVNWTRAMAIMSNLAGYQRDYVENIEINLRTADIKSMDYNSLVKAVKQLTQELDPNIIDAEPEEQE